MSKRRTNRRIGKYRLLARLGSGGHADVYRARDTVERVVVALKIPRPEYTPEFEHEIRLAVRLNHPNILPLKNADLCDGQLVLASPLGRETLADRMARRMSVARCLGYAEQMLEGLAYAHARRVIHCDVKPENLILFDDDLLCLCDFGIAKQAVRTMSASGSGTIGYVAPEQALGTPSFRSDVFSAGLVVYRMLAGELPRWPFEWPPPGHARLKRNVTPQFIAFLRRALQVDHRKRYRDAEQMLVAFRRALKPVRNRRRAKTGDNNKSDWRRVRQREFAKQHRAALRLDARCSRCAGPMSAEMQACPWCGKERRRHRGDVSFPACCGRCGRGRKLDWRFCAWCYGAGFKEVASREFSDRRYAARCTNHRCKRRLLMPYSRYCPWCRTKVRRDWKPPGATRRCSRCGWGVFREFWEFCPWCGASIA
ncbi:MAG: protein kinase domain-containing protein [Planctomycetota bacterium]|jgi:serine/threonine-protein kinase